MEFAQVSGKYANEFLGQTAFYFVEMDDSLVLTAGDQGYCIIDKFCHCLVIQIRLKTNPCLH